MTEQTMHPLQRALESTDQLRCQAYSGRGMYGEKCLGVVVSRWGDFLPLLVGACREESREDVEKIRWALSNVRQDSMGRDIILYFPQVPYVEVPRCLDCGEQGEQVGHWGCQYPQDR